MKKEKTKFVKKWKRPKIDLNDKFWQGKSKTYEGYFPIGVWVNWEEYYWSLPRILAESRNYDP